MRIVTGVAKGVRLAPVPEGVRPLSDRAREGVFSSLGPSVLDAAVLDLFAGTGAIGIEALSRGAAHATFVDRSTKATDTVHRNLEITHLADRATVETADVHRYLSGTAPAPFGLAFCDPPYELAGPDLQEVLQELADGWTDADATIVLTRGVKSSMPVIPVHWAVAKELRYGDSLLIAIRPRTVVQDLPGSLPGNA